jgi:NADH-quinone oxidoreductase subunit J
MVLQAIAFWLLAATTVIAALTVISARNPVHSVLFLITTFFSAAGLFVLLGAEFLAMILVVVYVGAVAVLFLFVVMMLDVALRQGFARYLPVGGAVAGVLTIEMAMVAWFVATGGAAAVSKGPVYHPGGSDSVTNAEAIGRVLYTDYVYFFQAAGLVLLVAMIGAIVLTLKHRVGVKRQDVGAQVGRTPAKGMRLVSIKSGEGIEL